MKKIHWLMLSLFLIIGMSGFALADPCTVSIQPGRADFSHSDTATATITVTDYTIASPTNRTLTLGTQWPCVMVKVDGMPNFITGNNPPSLTVLNGLRYNVSEGYSNTHIATSGPHDGFLVDGSGNEVKHTFTLTLKRDQSQTFVNNSEVYIYDNAGDLYLQGVDVGDSILIDKGDTTGHISVPEFPSIALPIAAILGLLYIMGRKRGDI